MNSMDTKSGKPAEEVIVDNSAGVEETDALMESVIADVEQEFLDEDLAAMPDEAPEVDASEQSEEPAADEGEQPAEDAAPDEEADRGTERLVKREVELRLKEDALKAREAKLDATEQENAQLKQKLADVEARIPTDFLDSLRANPWEALEGVGYDPEHIVRVVLAQKLQKQGKEVPKELREEIRAAEYDYKFKKQEQQLSQIEQQRHAAAFVAKVETEARQYIHAMTALKPEFSKDAPTVAKVAKADPERVYAEIMDEIGRDANARSREPGAQLISYAEAARRVEKRWGAMKKLLSDNPDNASTPADETKARSQQPGASTKQKPVAKPLTPAKPKTQEELEIEGIEAALADYKRVEMAKRKPVAPLRRA
jgi:hypothetical protein